MKNYSCKLKQLTLFVMFGAASALACANDGIVQDADGNYIITYTERISKGTFRMLFIPATKIDPTVRSSWRLENNVIAYRYRVQNGNSSKQYLDAVRIEPVSSLLTTPSILPKPADRLAYIDTLFDAARNSMRGPQGWNTAIIDIPNGFRLAWHISSQNPDMPSGLPPRTGSEDFSYRSQDLPGLATMRLTGDVIYPPGSDDQYDTDEMLDPTLEVAKQYHALEDKDFVPRNAAVPTIVVPVPFDAALLLDRIRNHVATWPNKQLVDPAFAVQLDRYLVSAADAYRHNQLKAGKEHLETLREMLKREHQDLDHDDDENGQRGGKSDDHRAANQYILIDRLAARILDFDLKYVLKRTEHEDDERRKH